MRISLTKNKTKTNGMNAFLIKNRKIKKQKQQFSKTDILVNFLPDEEMMSIFENICFCFFVLSFLFSIKDGFIHFDSVVHHTYIIKIFLSIP